MSFIKCGKLKWDFIPIFSVSMQSFLILFLSSIFVNLSILHNSMASSTARESTVVDLLFQFIESEKPTIPNKKALRYGIHRTKECQNFELAFLCVQKCTDLGYDIAHADKNCVCTCFRDRIKAQYTNKNKGVTRWRLGAPTTKLPLWAQTTTLTQGPDVELTENENEKSFEKLKEDVDAGVGNGNDTDNGTAVAGAGTNKTDVAAVGNRTVEAAAGNGTDAGDAGDGVDGGAGDGGAADSGAAGGGAADSGAADGGAADGGAADGGAADGGAADGGAADGAFGNATNGDAPANTPADAR